MSRQKRNSGKSSTVATGKTPSLPPVSNLSRIPKLGYLIAFVIGFGVSSSYFMVVHRPNPASQANSGPNQQSFTAIRHLPVSFYDLLAMSPEELGKVDIAVTNLVCAQGLPGAENLNIPSMLARLDEWAKKVRFETDRHLYRLSDPRYAEHYKYSEARLRVEFLVQCLQEDCGVHYNLERARNVDFSRPQDLFIHGMIGNDNGGTCSSMPVLYTAVGRRLGYPIKLVLAKQHVFCRWEDGKERLNIEGAGNGGVNFEADDFYRTWPIAISDTEMISGEFLKSLTPREEVATFLLQRASCLRAHRRVLEEQACLAEAMQLMPNSITLQTALRSMPVMQTRTAQRMMPWDDPNLPIEMRREMAPPADPKPGIPYRLLDRVN